MRVQLPAYRGVVASTGVLGVGLVDGVPVEPVVEWCTEWPERLEEVVCDLDFVGFAGCTDLVGFAVFERAGLAVCRRLCLVLAVVEVPGVDSDVEDERCEVLVVLSSARVLSVARPRARSNEVERRRSFMGWDEDERD